MCEELNHHLIKSVRLLCIPDNVVVLKKYKCNLIEFISGIFLGFDNNKLEFTEFETHIIVKVCVDKNQKMILDKLKNVNGTCTYFGTIKEKQKVSFYIVD